MLATLGVLWLHGLWVQAMGVAYLPYREFQQLLRDGQVKEVIVLADRIQGELVDGADRVAAFDAATTQRAVEAGLDPRGWSGTVQAVLGRIG